LGIDSALGLDGALGVNSTVGLYSLVGFIERYQFDRFMGLNCIVGIELRRGELIFGQDVVLSFRPVF
jgi:hypothetical protein